MQEKVNSKVQGGVVADYFGIKGFIPASQLLTDSEADLQIFVNQTLEVCVLQADRRRRNRSQLRRTPPGKFRPAPSRSSMVMDASS